MSGQPAEETQRPRRGPAPTCAGGRTRANTGTHRSRSRRTDYRSRSRRTPRLGHAVRRSRGIWKPPAGVGYGQPPPGRFAAGPGASSAIVRSLRSFAASRRRRIAGPRGPATTGHLRPGGAWPMARMCPPPDPGNFSPARRLSWPDVQSSANPLVSSHLVAVPVTTWCAVTAVPLKGTRDDHERGGHRRDRRAGGARHPARCRRLAGAVARAAGPPPHAARHQPAGDDAVRARDRRYRRRRPVVVLVVLGRAHLPRRRPRPRRWCHRPGARRRAPGPVIRRAATWRGPSGEGAGRGGRWAAPASRGPSGLWVIADSGIGR